jgi:hypothetical protein
MRGFHRAADGMEMPMRLSFEALGCVRARTLRAAEAAWAFAT